MKRTKTRLSYFAFLIALGGIFSDVMEAQATGANAGATTTLNASVSETLTMTTCGGTLTIPAVTSGTATSTTGACVVTTNGALGFNLKAKKTTASADATKTLVHTVDSSTWILDTSSGLSAYDGIGTSTALWSGSTKGLGFRVKTAGTTNVNTLSANWGASGDTTPEYAAFPTTDQMIYNYGSYSSASSSVTIEYKLDVPTTQKAGSYTGTVLYTATAN